MTSRSERCTQVPIGWGGKTSPVPAAMPPIGAPIAVGAVGIASTKNSDALWLTKINPSAAKALLNVAHHQFDWPRLISETSAGAAGSATSKAMNCPPEPPQYGYQGRIASVTAPPPTGPDARR